MVDFSEMLVLVITLGIIYIGVYLFGNSKQTVSSLSTAAKSLSDAAKNRNSSFRAIGNNFTSIEQIQQELRKQGLESSNLIIGIDYTKSNEFTGARSFGGKSLHAISNQIQNPYQQVISIIGRTLEIFDEDKLIPSYGFGDITTKGNRVFPFLPDRPCHTFNEVLRRYNEITPQLTLSGPTNFAPIIYESINIVKQQKDFHVLLIVADGQVTNEKETIDAIVEASKYPLSIVVIGVGDGPWDQMREFDDGLPQRKFDNFQFVDYNSVRLGSGNPDIKFAVEALMELPEQFKLVKQLKLM